MGRGKRRHSLSSQASASTGVAAPGSDLRVATVADLPALLTLKAAVVSSTYGELGTAEQRAEWLERFCSPQYFADRLASPDTVFLIVGPADEPRAMAALKRREGKAYFGDLYVADQRQGLGRALFARRLELAREWGLKTAVCDVFATNPAALAFVQALGFQPVSEYQEQSFQVPVIRHERAI